MTSFCSISQIFEVNGTRFGVAICHEGWRYPETVRWAAVTNVLNALEAQVAEAKGA